MGLPVVVVEIDPYVREYTCRLLAEAGYAVAAAPDSEEAVALLRLPAYEGARVVVLGVNQGMVAAAADIVNLFAVPAGPRPRTVLLMAPVELHEPLIRALGLTPGSVIAKPPERQGLLAAVRHAAGASTSASRARVN